MTPSQCLQLKPCLSHAHLEKWAAFWGVPLGNKLCRSPRNWKPRERGGRLGHLTMEFCHGGGRGGCWERTAVPGIIPDTVWVPWQPPVLLGPWMGQVSGSDHCHPSDWRETGTQDFAYQGKYALAGGPPVFLCVFVLRLGLYPFVSILCSCFTNGETGSWK